ncbi:monovalent cation/H(+) antiporter subunit G [Oceanomicrobium pacificus]|uniref:Na+/H+ antiporter subunit G n=1 Tax=Oceanomicrobium pacificus TaxID=2692916 RepID=A0A6B0TMT1_9RHOB|nr:monovalent cation/H(+) antiporter subunit G [Oceanomicrobium pacificus]MXU63879.1 Na+/H+ antiporter subunit G [Oceanomicrobium pacificus]
MEQALEIIAGLMVLAGGFFCLVAGIGVVKLPDLFMRMHASTKAGTVGVGLTCLSLVLVGPTWIVAGKAVAVTLFMIATAPIGSHLIGRAAYRAGFTFWEPTIIEPIATETFPVDDDQA